MVYLVLLFYYHSGVCCCLRHIWYLCCHGKTLAIQRQRSCQKQRCNGISVSPMNTLTALVCVTFDIECNHTLLDFPDASFGVYTYIALVTLLHTYKLVAILNYSVLHPVYTKRESIPETTGSCNMFLYETCRWQTAQFGAPNISKCAVLRTIYQTVSKRHKTFMANENSIICN